MNFSSLINQIAKRLPDKVAIIDDGQFITYKELWQKIEGLTNSLLELGLKRDDRVAIILPNCKEFIYAFFAILRANLIAVPINQRLTVFELNKIFSNCNPSLVIINNANSLKILDKDKTLLDDRIVIISDSDEKRGYLSLTTLYKPKRFRPIQKEFITSNEQIASINYTYRGYGYPLGAMLTHGNYIRGAAGYIRLVEPSLNQRFLLIMPISHIFTLIGCVVVPLLRGSTVVIMKNIIPSRIFKAIEQHKIDFLVSVPTIYQVLLRNFNRKRYDISSLKYGITGGAPMDLELYKELKSRMGFEVLQGYGLTETLPISCNPKSKIKPDSVGVIGRGAVLKIVDEKGHRKKPGESGEILIGGVSVMKGYFNRERETKDVLMEGGWVRTGDYGRVDREGYLYFEGVMKNIAKVGGDTADLKEVENVLLTYPNVIEAKIIARPDRLWGQILEAQVRLNNSPGHINEKDLISFCGERLAIHKIPRRIKINKC